MPNAKTDAGNAPHRFLILGDTGGGKTTQFLSLPGKKFCYIFDSNALLSLRGNDVDYEEFLPDRLNMNVHSLSKEKGGDKVTKYQSDLFIEWQKDFDKKMNEGIFDQYDVIGMDSATTFLDLIMDRTLTINGRAGQWPQQDDYGPQMVTFTNVCRVLTAMNKTVYMTGHLDMRQDELTKKVYRQPMMTGRLRTKIPLLFSDIFVASSEVDANGKVRYRMQTVPDRITTTVRCSFRGLNPFEDVTLDFSKPLENQGLGALIKAEKR